MGPLVQLFSAVNKQLDKLDHFLKENASNSSPQEEDWCEIEHKQSSDTSTNTKRPLLTVATIAAGIGSLYFGYHRPYSAFAGAIAGALIPLLKRNIVNLEDLSSQLSISMTHIQNIWNHQIIREGFAYGMIPAVAWSRNSLAVFTIGLGYKLGSYGLKV